MKIVIRKIKNDYPESNFRRVDLVLEDGKSIPLFGITKETKRGVTYWDHDSRPLYWHTQLGAKLHAEKELSYYYPEIIQD